MKLVYIGFDLLYPALPALERAGCAFMELVTCETDNVTEFNTQVRAFAKTRRIPLRAGRVDHADLTRWKRGGCDAVVCGGFYYRLPVDPALPMVNIHPSLLPVGRGAWPMPWVILRGLPDTGVTIHKITGEFDEGDILLQERVTVEPGDDLNTLTARLQGVLPQMVERLAADFEGLWANARPQGQGEYWPCPSEADYPITPDMGAEEADRILRAFYGYECVYRDGARAFGLTGGRVWPTGGGFPVRGGVVRAERVRELCV